MRFARLVLVALVALVAATSASAQRIPAPSPVTAIRTVQQGQSLPWPRSGLNQWVDVPRQQVAVRFEGETYWKEGFVVGTVVMSLAILPFAGWNGDSITFLDVVKVVACGSLVGGVPGAMFGGLFPKRE